MGVLASIIDRSISGEFSSDASSVGGDTFLKCINLSSVSFPNAVYIGNNAFSNCSNLSSVSFPNVVYISSNAFHTCSNLSSVSFPKVVYIGEYAFYKCTSLTSVSLPNVVYIENYAFRSCGSSLTTISVGTSRSDVCQLEGVGVFQDCANLTNIYVPSSLVDKYKSDTNWSSYADKIKAAP